MSSRTSCRILTSLWWRARWRVRCRRFRTPQEIRRWLLSIPRSYGSSVMKISNGYKSMNRLLQGCSRNSSWKVHLSNLYFLRQLVDRMISRKIGLWCLAFRHRLKAVIYILFHGDFVIMIHSLLISLTHIMPLMHFSISFSSVFTSIFFGCCFIHVIDFRHPPCKFNSIGMILSLWSFALRKLQKLKIGTDILLHFLQSRKAALVPHYCTKPFNLWIICQSHDLFAFHTADSPIGKAWCAWSGTLWDLQWCYGIWVLVAH